MNSGTGMAKRFNLGTNVNPLAVLPKRWAEEIMRLNLAQ